MIRRSLGGWPLRRRATVAYLALVALGLLGLGYAIATYGALNDARIRLTDRLSPASIASAQWTEALLDEDRGLRGYLLTADPRLLGAHEAGRVAAEEARAELHEALELKPELHDELAVADALSEEWESVVAELVSRVEPGEVPENALDLLAEGEAGFADVRAGFDALGDAIAQRRALARHDLDDKSFDMAVALGAVSILLAVTVGATWLAIRSWVLSPLGGLRGAARRVADGDVRARVDVSGPPDMVQLGEDVEAMRQRIVDELAIVEQARERLEAQTVDLIRSNEELEQFAYVASHDLQEPLRKVTGFCQLLERRYKGQLDERADEYIAYAVDGAKRMQLLINDLLSFSRVGRTTDRFTSVDLDAVAARAVATLEHQIQESGATVTVDPLPTITGDATLLETLLQNLIGNALKFRSDAPPEVHVSARREGAVWHLRCRDNGIGIEPQFAERVFVIFQRLNDREAYAGTGIGLALCRKVVEFHGGTIEVEPSDGPGTVIHVTLPVERDPDPAVPVAVARGAEPPTSGSSPAVGSSGHTEEA
ncbi:MAG TPA: ATP-binding protein [Acidimicrobiales bacterium]